MKLDISKKQAEMIHGSQRAVQQAMSQAQAVIQTVLAGHDYPEGAEVQTVTADPPQIILTLPEEDDDDGDS